MCVVCLVCFFEHLSVYCSVCLWVFSIIKVQSYPDFISDEANDELEIMELLSEKDDEIEKDEEEDMDASLEIDDTPAKGSHQVSA